MNITGVSSAVDILRVTFGMAFLCYASYCDLKTRRVRNEVWLLMGFTGGVILLLQMFLEERGWEYYLIFAPVTILFASMFFDFGTLLGKKERKLNLRLILLIIIGLAALAFQFSVLSAELYFYKLLTIPLLILVFFIFYQSGILHGGADAKAMMAIAIFTPFYPHFFGFPLIQFGSERISEAVELFFPFAFLVLMNAVIVVVWIFLAFLLYNLSRKDFGMPQMLLGYKMDIDEAEKKFVWPMERVVSGERVLVLFPKRRNERDLEKLRELGEERIWVTPKVPFITAIAGGFLLSAVVGNIFWAAMGSLV